MFICVESLDGCLNERRIGSRPTDDGGAAGDAF